MRTVWLGWAGSVGGGSEVSPVPTRRSVHTLYRAPCVYAATAAGSSLANQHAPSELTELCGALLPCAIARTLDDALSAKIARASIQTPSSRRWASIAASGMINSAHYPTVSSDSGFSLSIFREVCRFRRCSRSREISCSNIRRTYQCSMETFHWNASDQCHRFKWLTKRIWVLIGYTIY